MVILFMEEDLELHEADKLPLPTSCPLILWTIVDGISKIPDN
jgi:hypothetical protein